MSIAGEWITAWNTASRRTRVVACLLLFGANQIGFAAMFLDDFGRLTEGNAKAARAMALSGLVIILAAIFLAASKIVRTSQGPDERNQRIKDLLKMVSWYALVGPFHIVLHRVSELPAVQGGLLLAGGLGLMHLTAKVSLLLENEGPAHDGFNPLRTQTLDNQTSASEPGNVRLSHAKLREFHSYLYEPSGLYRLLSRLSPWQQFWLTRHEEHLRYGDSRAAVVVCVHPLLVAAYTDELDCVAILRFDPALVARYALRDGTKLLTVNTYTYGDVPVCDLESSPGSYGRYANFAPLIAEFLSDDDARIAERKAEISEAEWTRAEQLGRDHLRRHGHRARDGRPMLCDDPCC